MTQNTDAWSPERKGCGQPRLSSSFACSTIAIRCEEKHSYIRRQCKRDALPRSGHTRAYSKLIENGNGAPNTKSAILNTVAQKSVGEKHRALHPTTPTTNPKAPTLGNKPPRKIPAKESGTCDRKGQGSCPDPSRTWRQTMQYAARPSTAVRLRGAAGVCKGPPLPRHASQ